MRSAGVSCPKRGGRLALAEGFFHRQNAQGWQSGISQLPDERELLLLRPSPQPLQLKTSPVSSGFLGLGCPAPPPTSVASQFPAPPAPNTGLLCRPGGERRVSRTKPHDCFPLSRPGSQPSLFKHPPYLRGTPFPLGVLGTSFTISWAGWGWSACVHSTVPR